MIDPSSDEALLREMTVWRRDLLVGDGVRFVIGHQDSGASIPASDVYAEANVLQITPASTNPKFTDRGLRNAFRTCGRDDQQGTVAGDYLARTYAGGKVFIVYDTSTYGKGLADETKKAMKPAGSRLRGRQRWRKELLGAH